ncbi:hypothetical protein AGMMS49950_01860 [Endomicrobiia bacterium]|nr:hypothetical protein AGMMS49950_01860 [Endomicrobiia bacterium]
MKKLILQVALSIFLSSLVFANSNADSERAVCLRDSLKKDSFTFSTAYLEGRYTNKQLAGFNLELLNASDMAFASSRNIFVRLLMLYTLYQINDKAKVALHEIGHGSRVRSIGIDYKLTHYFGHDCYDGKKENYFEYFLEEIFDIDSFGFFRQDGRGGCLPNPNQVKNLSDKFDDDIVHNLFLVCHAGGMNNDIYFAERISDDIYTRNKETRLLPYILYLKNRFSPIEYDRTAKELGDDPFNIREDFKKKGRLDFKEGFISDAGLRSLFLSGTTYSPLYWFFTKKPLRLYGFRIPDVFPYITTKGMSYKVVSGYEINEDLKLIFGFERVFKVEPATEYSLGVEQTTIINRALPISYRGVVTFGQGLDLEASCSIPISKYLSIGAGLEIYSCKSLQGQRHATSGMLDKNGLSHNISVSMSYKF